MADGGVEDCCCAKHAGKEQTGWSCTVTTEHLVTYSAPGIVQYVTYIHTLVRAALPPLNGACTEMAWLGRHAQPPFRTLVTTVRSAVLYVHTILYTVRVEFARLEMRCGRG